MREYPWTIVRGFFMGTADLVPGVSGGTIALVFGIYRRLIASIRAASSALGHLIRLDGRGMVSWLGRVEWGFLIPIVAGIALAIVVLATALETLLEDYPVALSALFFGLVAGSIVVAWGLLRARDARRMVILISVGLALFLALGIRAGTSAETVGQTAEPALWAFFASGALAICAMILPGISGSLILVLLGMYAPVIGAVTDRDLLVLSVFALGAVVGLALFSQLLHWALGKHYDSVMAALIGLMLGSLRVLWPWPNGIESTALGAPDVSVLAALALAVAAFATVLGISVVVKRTERPQEPTELRST